MASRHDIIHIDFEANAGKASPALKSLKQAAKDAHDQIEQLKKDLNEGIKAGKSAEEIEKLRSQIKALEKDERSFNKGIKELTKGVDRLSEGIEAFNNGSLNKMSAAFNKAVQNAAKLAKTKISPDTAKGRKDIAEMDALIDATQKNILKANQDFKTLYNTIKSGGSVSNYELKQAVDSLKELSTLTAHGSEEWKVYQKQLTAVEDKMRALTADEQRMAGQRTLGRASRGDFATSDRKTLEDTIAKLKEYQSVIQDPKGSGAQQFAAAGEQIQKLQGQLDGLKQKEMELSGQSMSLVTALRTGVQSLRGTFQGTTQQLTLAKKVLEENLQTATRGSAAYNGIQRALTAIEIELKKVSVISKETQAVLDAPKGKSFNELKAAIEQGRMALNNMRTDTKEGKAAFDELAGKVKRAEIEMKNLGGASKGAASSFEKAWSRLKTYISLYMGAAVAIQKLTGAFGDLLEMSDKMGEVRKTTGFSADEVGRLSEELKKMDTRTALNGLLDLSVAAGQLGLKTEQDVLGFTEAANKLMVALPEMGKEGATEMLKVALATGEIDKIRRQMDEGLIEGSSATAVAMEKVGSTIDRLRATSAATAPAITDFVKRVGAVGSQSGISIDQVAALGSTVDALGMRVEMSATALSRMMPAIRNNAFDLAKILKVEPNTIRELYDTGRGMEVILMILQRIKDSNMNADSIEDMLGMAGMKEIMKELNQQGARAGIVFGGLSQNVDELRRQLGVAKQAYEENIAIQQEYDKMNETTAAKWERLKNQIEEAFLGDLMQRSLGVLIDVLRAFVDFLTGNVGPALQFVSILVKTFLTYWGLMKIGLGEGIFIKAIEGIKNMGSGMLSLISNTKQYIIYSKLLKRAQTEQARAAIEARMAQEGLNKAMIANVWTAVIAAVIALGIAMYNWIDSMKEAGREAAKFQAELDKEQKKVNDLTNSIGEVRVKIEEANKEVENARTALDAAKKATDGSVESTKRLAKAEAELMAKEEQKKNLMAEHKRLIEDFNSQYGKYLGFMLSEVSSNLELARARDLVNSKLRETITLKQQEAALERVEKQYGEARDKAYGALYDNIPGGGDVLRIGKGGRKVVEKGDPTTRPRVMAALVKAANTSKNKDEFVAKTLKIFKDNNVSASALAVRNAVNYYNELQNFQKATNREVEQFKGQLKADRQMSQKELVGTGNASVARYNELWNEYRGAKGDERAQKAADVLKQLDTLNEMQANASSYYDMNDPEEAAAFRKQFGSFVSWKGPNRAALLKEAGKYYTPRKTMKEATGGGFTPSRNLTSGGGGGSMWGNEVEAASTEYSTWDVNELVNRRNQMNKFKNVLKPGIDVRAVLAEDKALMKAIDEGKVGADWQSVLDWYNAERKKIQQELKSERFSTNEGNWRDETTKKGRVRRNPLVESDYALAELDRYYSRRKEALEKARSEENISEELYNRQQELLEQEHLERRSKLRGTFTGEVSKEETAAFRMWWANLEKMDELDHVPWEVVESEWAKALAAQIGRNNLRMQQDMTKVESITMKHVNAIAKIIAKERPYDGIVENLRDNLTKLDILFADYGTLTKQQLEDGSLTKEMSRRLSFLLDEAKRAYSLTAEQLMTDMREKGFGSWADAIANDKNGDELKRQMLAQLQTAYDAVQEAIKKEATLMKKQVEIQWNDRILPNGQSQKQAFESTLSALGLDEDRVKRANSLIGAGQASERIADKLAIQQMKVKLAMQEQYYFMLQKIGNERIAQLEAAGKLEDAEHVRKSLNLALSEEQKKKDEQRVAIENQLEESQNRLYKELKSWAGLLTSSLQSVFEASNTGLPEYYNQLAKMRLTGEGSGGGTYIITENAGTKKAAAHYEYLDGEAALRRQLEIDQQNATADAMKKAWDDINMKISETITDQINAMLQNAAIDANTKAVNLNAGAVNSNTAALQGLTAQLAQGIRVNAGETQNGTSGNNDVGDVGGLILNPVESVWDLSGLAAESSAERQVAALNKVDEALTRHFHKQVQTTTEANNKTQTSTQGMFAKMTQAANLYGIAYQAMSNDNLSATQKFEMIALQAVGNGAIAALTTDLAVSEGKTATELPGILGKATSTLGPIAGPIAFAALTALLGGLMGMAVSKIAKSKSTIASVTGASVGAGRLSTGMLTYAEGNVNEFTDPSSLTPGRQYNVDAADGRTYRARYMGANPRTHITNGPEFHLSGEKGREMIIDAGTTRQITMNDNEIWRAIQTLSGGGSMRTMRRRRGVRAFAEGNLDDFTESTEWAEGTEDLGMSVEQMASLQSSIDRQNALLEELRTNGVKGVFNVYGPDGLVASYDKGKKETLRHGEKH